jgi:HEAT repeat protein
MPMDAFRTKLDEIVERMGVDCRASTRANVDAVLGAGVDTLDGLYGLLADRSAAPSLRITAAWLIRRLGDSRAAKALMTVLDDDSTEVRCQAIIELGGVRATEAVDALLRLLDDGDLRTRMVVTHTLGEIGDGRAHAPLLALLVDYSQSPDLRGQAAESLASLENRSDAVPALIAALDDDEVVVRFWAAFALGAIADPGALAALDRVAANDHAPVPGFSTVSDEARESAEIIRSRQSRA